MAKQNTRQSVNNQYPKAVVVFLTLDSEGKPIKDLASSYTIVPDVEDIQSIQMALGSTGNTGQFTLMINNPNYKYYVKDDIEKEIENLKEGGSVSYDTGNPRQDETSSQTSSPKMVWESAEDFLNDIVYDRMYSPPNANKDDFIFILYQDGTSSNGDPILKYRKIPKSDLEAYDYAKEIDIPESAEDHAKLASIERKMQKKIEDAGTSVQEDSVKVRPKNVENSSNKVANYSNVTVPANQLKDIVNRAQKQSAFFEEFGGQVEHGRCVFEPMQLCVILTSRRFKEVDDPEDMVVTFTGYVDSVSDEFDGKSQLIRVQGSDVTKLMRITLANINPSLFEANLQGTDEYRIWGNKFSGMLGWQIIKVLTLGGQDAAGQRVYGAGNFEYDPEVSPQNSTSEKSKRIASIALLEGIQLHKTDIDDKLDKIFFAPGKVHLQVLPFDTSSKGFADYSVYKKIFKSSFQNWQNEYRNHLELANEVTKLTNYEFYADQLGHVWYHQPRFNNYHLLTSENPEVYVLRDEDIMNFNFSESDKDVVTSVYVMGQPNYVETTPQILKMTAKYEDIGLLLKYGRRYMTAQHPYITESINCFYFAKSLLLRRNAGRFVGKVTLIGRPEIRVHMPVYVPLRNMIYYVTGIQHSFNYGKTFTTTLTLKYGHKPWEILPEILDYRTNQSSLTAEKKSRDQADQADEVPDEESMGTADNSTEWDKIMQNLDTEYPRPNWTSAEPDATYVDPENEEE